MAAVVGVRFKNAGKLYYCDPGTLWPVAGCFVIVETSRGIEYGQVITGVRHVDDEMISAPLKPVLRVADERDAEHFAENQRFEAEAYRVCQRKIEEHQLDMKLVGVEQTFDNAKILFYFTANGRVDFRSLVKDLASVFRTRIELRQIGVRDEAKMLGGLGPCGRPICCGSFLGDFQPVSIKMAKEQNLSLNPTKISGVCGRLMCCLKFEQDHYEQTRKRMPKIGKDVETPDGSGMVTDINVLKETVNVRVRKGDSSEFKVYPLEEIKWARPAPMENRPRNPKPMESTRVPRMLEETPHAAQELDMMSDESIQSYEEQIPAEQETAQAQSPNAWMKAVEEALHQANRAEKPEQ